jgi:hypothetical protein
MQNPYFHPGSLDLKCLLGSLANAASFSGSSFNAFAT